MLLFVAMTTTTLEPPFLKYLAESFCAILLLPYGMVSMDCLSFFVQGLTSMAGFRYRRLYLVLVVNIISQKHKRMSYGMTLDRIQGSVQPAPFICGP